MPADHQKRKLLGVGFILQTLRNHLAAAHDIDAIRNVHDLLKLVRDEHDALAEGAKLPHRIQQAVNLQWREHGGGLVEYDDVRALIKDFQDFDALAKPDRTLVDASLRIDLEHILVRKRLHGFERLAFIQKQPFGDFVFEYDILRYAHALKKHEMLLHHADARGHSVGRIVKAHLFAPHIDIALGRLFQSV